MQQQRQEIPQRPAGRRMPCLAKARLVFREVPRMTSGAAQVGFFLTNRDRPWYNVAWIGVWRSGAECFETWLGESIQAW